MNKMEQERKEWEAKHPNLDYDVYIDGRINQEREDYEK